jgi:hypothetical protein
MTHRENSVPRALFHMQIAFLIIATLLFLATTDATAQQEAPKIANPDLSLKGCWELGFDFENGFYASVSGAMELRYKQFERKAKNYAKEHPNDKDAQDIADFLKEIGPQMPDYFQGDYKAAVRINEAYENGRGEKDRKKAWLQAAVGGKAMGKKDRAVVNVKGWQVLKVYDEEATSKGAAEANLKQPYDAKFLGLDLFTVDIGTANATASDEITIYNKPGGEPQAKMKAGARLWARDGTDAWKRVTYANDEGELVWGYMFGDHIKKFAKKHLDTDLPKSGKGKEKL